jgi:hypothetical protein
MNFIFNLNETLNAERMVPQMRCGHCGQLGHTMPHCRRALSDGHNLHLRIVNAMRNVRENLNYYIQMLLNNMTIRQLKLLMHAIKVEGRGTTFIRTLAINGVISWDVSLLRVKQDRITILMWFYLNHAVPNNHNSNRIPIQTKLGIVSHLIINEDQEFFDCPICLNSHDKKEKILSNCNHVLCKPCLTNYLDHHIANTFSDKKPCCSLCRTNITSIAFANNDYKEEVSNKYFTSVDDLIN